MNGEEKGIVFINLRLHRAGREKGREKKNGCRRKSRERLIILAQGRGEKEKKRQGSRTRRVVSSYEEEKRGKERKRSCIGRKEGKGSSFRPCSSHHRGKKEGARSLSTACSCLPYLLIALCL